MTEKPERDNIQVSIRIKPLLEEARSCIKLDPNLKNTIVIDANNQQEQKYFYFDYVAPADASQEDIFTIVGKQQAINCLEGYNGCVFVYGQTGSGKTYTMMGTQKQPGLLPRVLEFLFNCIYQDTTEMTEYLVKCSYLEIYNEHIIDLLNPQSGNLQLREDLKRGVYVEYLSEESCTNVSDALEVLNRGSANRHISSTNMNIESSRSHSVFTIQVESRRQSSQTQVINHRFSRFHFVDLAGSERQKQSQVQGERLREGCNINRSLHILGNVINALVEDSQQYVHYRDSKLTFLLKDSLGGNSRTHLIANIQQTQQFYQETLSTLMFSKRVKQVKNKARVNEDESGNLEALKNEIKRLKQELARTLVQTPSTWESPSKPQRSVLQSEQFLSSLELEGALVSDSKYIKLEEILKCYLEQSTESEAALWLELEKYLTGIKQLQDAFAQSQLLEQQLKLIIKLQNEQILRLRHKNGIEDIHIPAINVDQALLSKIFLENLKLKEPNTQAVQKAQFQVDQNVSLLKEIVETVNNSLVERRQLQTHLDQQYNSQYVTIDKFQQAQAESEYKTNLLTEQSVKLVHLQEICQEQEQKTQQLNEDFLQQAKEFKANLLEKDHALNCLNEQMLAMKVEISNQNTQNDQLKETANQLYRECETLLSEKEALESELQQARSKFSQQEAQWSKVQVDFASQLERLNELKSKLEFDNKDQKKTIMELNHYYSEQIESQNRVIQELKIQVSQVEEQNELLRVSIRDSQSLSSEQFSNIIEKHNEQIQSLSKQFEEKRKVLEEKLQLSAQKGQEKELQIAQLQQTLKQLQESHHSQKQQLVLQINELNQVTFQKDVDSQQVRLQLSNAEQTLIEYEQLNHSLQGNLNLLQQQLESKEALIQESVCNFNLVHEQYSALDNQIKALNAKNGLLQEKERQADEAIAKLQRQLEEKCQELQSRLKQFSVDGQISEGKIAELNQKLKIASQQAESLREEAEALETALQKTKAKVRDQESIISHLQQSNSSLENRVEEGKLRIAQLEQTLGQQAEDQRESQLKAQQIGQQSARLESQCKIYENEIKRLGESIKNHQYALEQYASLESSFSQQRQQLKDMEKRLVDSLQSNQQLMARATEQEEATKTLEDINSNLECQNREQGYLIEALQKQNIQLKNELESDQSSKEGISKDLETTHRQIAQLKGEISVKDEKIAFQQDVIANLTEELDKHRHELMMWQADVKTLQIQIEQRDEALSQMSEQTSALQAWIENHESESGKLQEVCARHQKELALATEKAKQFKEELDKASELKERLEAQIAQQKEQITHTKAIYERELEEHETILQNSTQIWRKETESLEEENQLLRTQIDALQSEVEQQRSEHKRLDCQLPLLHDILKQKGSQIENLVNQITKLEYETQEKARSHLEEVQKLEAKIEEGKSQVKKLTKQLDFEIKQFDMNIKRMEDQYAQQLEQIKRDMKEQEEVIQQREKQIEQLREKNKIETLKHQKIVQGLEASNQQLKHSLEDQIGKMAQQNKTHEIQLVENQDKYQLLKEQFIRLEQQSQQEGQIRDQFTHIQEKLVRENSDLKMKIEKKQGVITQLEQALIQNEETLKSVHEKAKEFCRMQEKEINDIKDQYLKLEAEHQAILCQNQEKEDEIEVMREQKEQMLRQLSQQKEEIGKLKKEIGDLNDKLQKGVQERNMLNKHIEEMLKDIQQLGGHNNPSQKIRYLNQIKQENSSLKQEKLYLSEQLQKEMEEKQKILTQTKQEFGKVDVQKLLTEHQRMTQEMQKLNQILNLTGVKSRYSTLKGTEGDKIIQSVQLLIQELIVKGQFDGQDCKQEIQQRSKEWESKNLKYQSMEKDLLLMKQRFYAVQRDNSANQKALSPTGDSSILKDTRLNLPNANANSSAQRQIKNKQVFQFQGLNQ